MKNKLSPPYISSLDLRTLNDAIIGIYRHLNRIANSADEITFKNTEDGTKEIIIKDGNKKYEWTYPVAVFIKEKFDFFGMMGVKK